MMDGVLFVAAQTPRSQAYAQAMLNAGLSPEHTLLFGKESGHQPGQLTSAVQSPNSNGVQWTKTFVPDLSETLTETCERGKWLFQVIDVENVNHADILDWIKSKKARLVIYGGFGGQLVGNELLDLGVPFLHTHAGWLPDYRGSTTIYYSILSEKRCAVSAFLLEKTIDTGPIIDRKYYDPPHKGFDIDYLYDGAIRADLMISVLTEWLHVGRFTNQIQQHPEEGTNYYVIHPVLKHLAILSLER
ncbi:MAG: methionyl-tRNA formyltransferase [Gammaproteobacteria bacterium]|nr:methionyl-tRNA formyltransferase [Gammaproteobacteria bacterium]